MSTTYNDGSTFEEVFGPDDVADIRRRLERGRWWRFLNAKDRLLAAFAKARRSVTNGFWKAAEALRLEGVVVGAHRLMRHAVAKAAPVVSIVKAAGVVPTLAWAGTTEHGRRIIVRTSRAVIRAAFTAVRLATRGAGEVVRAFGPRGVRLADRMGAYARRSTLTVVVTVAAAVRPVRPVWAFREVAFQAAGAWGRRKAVSGLLGHFLPGRWARLAQLLTTMLVIPGGAVRQLLAVVLPPKAAPVGVTGTAPAGPAVKDRGPRVVRSTPTVPVRVTTERIQVVDDAGWDRGEHLVTPVTHEEMAADPVTDVPDIAQHQPGHGTGQRRVRPLGDEDRAGTTGRYPAKKQRSRRRP